MPNSKEHHLFVFFHFFIFFANMVTSHQIFFIAKPNNVILTKTSLFFSISCAEILLGLVFFAIRFKVNLGC